MELTSLDIAVGIGRKATSEELIEYLLKEADQTPIKLSEAFAKYETE